MSLCSESGGRGRRKTDNKQINVYRMAASVTKKKGREEGREERRMEGRKGGSQKVMGSAVFGRVAGQCWPQGWSHRPILTHRFFPGLKPNGTCLTGF